MIYAVVFFVAALFTHLCQKETENRKKYQAFFCAVIAILLPSILGGCRSMYLGTDNISYVNTFNKIAQAGSLAEAVGSSREYISRFLFYVISRFTEDYHWWFFVTELITMTFVFLGLYKFRERFSMGLGMLVYLFCFYCIMINLVRQGISLAICFFAFGYAVERRPIKFLIYTAVAVLFHSSALLFLFIYPMYVFLKGKTRMPYEVKAVLMCAAVFIVVLLFEQVTNLLVNLNFLPETYTFYSSGTVGFDLGGTLTRLPLLLIGIYTYHILERKEPLYKFFFFMQWVSLVVCQLSTVVSHAYRVALYFDYFTILQIPMLRRSVKQDRGNLLMADILIIAYLIAFFVFWVVNNNHGFHYPVYPYLTDLF